MTTNNKKDIHHPCKSHSLPSFVMTEEKKLSSIPLNPDESSNAMEQVSVLASKNNDNSDEEPSTQCCPLFMTGLPKDFSTNPQLAALASLLDDDDDDDDEDDGVDNKKSDQDKRQLDNGGCTRSAGRFKTDMPMTRGGGGKVRLKKSRAGRRSQGAPYVKPAKTLLGEETNKKEKAASLGEAQLFLNMWKL
jgi:hypothetical protein